MFAHPAQVAETLSSLVGEGKIRAVGVSNHTPAQHDALIAHLGDLPLATSQPEYSPAFLGPLRDGTFDLCMRDGIVPLACGAAHSLSWLSLSGVCGRDATCTMSEGIDNTSWAYCHCAAPAYPLGGDPYAAYEGITDDASHGLVGGCVLPLHASNLTRDASTAIFSLTKSAPDSSLLSSSGFTVANLTLSVSGTAWSLAGAAPTYSWTVARPHAPWLAMLTTSGTVMAMHMTMLMTTCS